MSYLVAAYIVIWGVLAGYLWIQGKRQRRLENEIRLLTEMIRETESASGTKEYQVSQMSAQVSAP